MPARFSYQLYSSRNHGPLERTLSMLARLGYGEVEGYGGVYGAPQEVRALLERNGLTMPSGHFGLAMMEGKLKEVLSIARTLGMNMLVIPWLEEAERPRSASGWRALGKRLNGIAAAYRQEGFSVAWHNHDFEFAPLKDGSVPQALIFDHAPQLDWEIDVAWVVRGKANALKWIRDYGSIITSAHVKDIARRGENADEDGWADVGHGTVKWADCLAALRKTRCMHYVMEHDNPLDDERFAKRSIAAAKKL